MGVSSEMTVTLCKNEGCYWPVTNSRITICNKCYDERSIIHLTCLTCRKVIGVTNKEMIGVDRTKYERIGNWLFCSVDCKEWELDKTTGRYTGNACGIIYRRAHKFKVQSDPESLTTGFIEDIIGVHCNKLEKEGM